MTDYHGDNQLLRRTITIILLSLSFFLNCYAIWKIRSLQSSNSGSNRRMRLVLYGISVNFLIHCATAIFVTVMKQLHSFELLEVAMMGISCATNLFYMILMLYPMWCKLIIMTKKSIKPIVTITCLFIAITKTASFVLLVVIASTAAAKVEHEFEEEFEHDPLTQIAEIVNMAANQVYSLFLLVAIVSYSRFLSKFLSERAKIVATSASQIVKDQGKDLDAHNTSITRYWNISIVGFSLAAVITCALSFRNTAHAVGISVNGLTSSVLHLFNIWLDQNLIHNIKGSAQKSKSQSASNVLSKVTNN